MKIRERSQKANQNSEEKSLEFERMIEDTPPTIDHIIHKERAKNLGGSGVGNETLRVLDENTGRAYRRPMIMYAYDENTEIVKVGRRLEHGTLTESFLPQSPKTFERGTTQALQATLGDTLFGVSLYQQILN